MNVNNNNEYYTPKPQKKIKRNTNEKINQYNTNSTDSTSDNNESPIPFGSYYTKTLPQTFNFNSPDNSKKTLPQTFNFNSPDNSKKTRPDKKPAGFFNKDFQFSPKEYEEKLKSSLSEVTFIKGSGAILLFAQFLLSKNTTLKDYGQKILDIFNNTGLNDLDKVSHSTKKYNQNTNPPSKITKSGIKFESFEHNLNDSNFVSVDFNNKKIYLLLTMTITGIENNNEDVTPESKKNRNAQLLNILKNPKIQALIKDEENINTKNITIKKLIEDEEDADSKKLVYKDQLPSFNLALFK
jgi:hypothetical protein